MLFLFENGPFLSPIYNIQKKTRVYFWDFKLGKSRGTRAPLLTIVEFVSRVINLFWSEQRFCNWNVDFLEKPCIFVLPSTSNSPYIASSFIEFLWESISLNIFLILFLLSLALNVACDIAILHVIWRHEHILTTKTYFCLSILWFKIKMVKIRHVFQFKQLMLMNNIVIFVQSLTLVNIHVIRNWMKNNIRNLFELLIIYF